MSDKVAVVTGANTGIGLAIVRGLCRRFRGAVYLTSRDEARGREALASLQREGLAPRYHQLDVTDRASVTRLRDHLAATHGAIDILFNNAGVASNDLLYNTFEECERIVNVNYTSILTIQELLFPLLRDNARVINVSSNCGHLSNLRNEYWIKRLSSKDLSMKVIDEFVDWFLDSVKTGTFRREDFADEGKAAAYRVSKVALSALTMLQQQQLASRNVSVNSLHPGLVRTNMTGGVGFLSADEAALTPLYMALEAPQSVKGQYVWYDRQVLDWYNSKADYYFKSSTLTNTF